jgi:hypothetical protein
VDGSASFRGEISYVGHFLIFVFFFVIFSGRDVFGFLLAEMEEVDFFFEDIDYIVLFRLWELVIVGIEEIVSGRFIDSRE